MNTGIKITVISDDNETMLVSLATEGDFSDEMIDRRFYSIPEMPPPDLPPRHFWGSLLGSIAPFLSSDE